jgi:hypothetical protein
MFADHSPLLGRRGVLRRSFFCLIGLGFASCLGGFSASARAQDTTAIRILERRVRLTRSEAGEYRLLEALQVRLASAEHAVDSSAPLPLITLPVGASEVLGLGGDLPPARVTRDDGKLVVVGRIPTRSLQVAFTYLLPASATAVELLADWPVDELRVYVDRGVVEASPDPALTSQGEVGPAEQPRLSYTASNLAAERGVRLSFRSGGVGWRQRLGVLLATTFAAVAALLWAWLRRHPTREAKAESAR